MTPVCAAFFREGAGDHRGERFFGSAARCLIPDGQVMPNPLRRPRQDLEDGAGKGIVHLTALGCSSRRSNEACCDQDHLVLT
jgi:hypothetical protein